MKKLIGYCTKDSMYDGAFNSVVGWKAAGMGYVIKTENGKTIVVDGGNTCDAYSFCELLSDNNDAGDVEVDCWIITHPHGDHYGCLYEMSKTEDILKNITVKNLVYFFPEGFRDKNGNSCAKSIKHLEEIRERFNADVIIPDIDTKITIDGAKIDFLYVPTDYAEIKNPNSLSLIFTVTLGKKIMFTGDAFKPNLRKMAEKYGEQLKSDILQMPHHALCDTGYLDFFKFVDAKTVMIPTCIAGYREMNANEEYRVQNVANKYAEDNAHIVYKSFEGNFEILL